MKTTNRTGTCVVLWYDIVFHLGASGCLRMASRVWARSFSNVRGACRHGPGHDDDADEDDNTKP